MGNFWQRLYAVFTARNLEFWRDTSAMAWNFMMPVLVVFGFAFTFSGKGQDVFKVALLNPTHQATDQNPFLRTQYVQFVPFDDESTALERLRHHQVDLVFRLGGSKLGGGDQYWVNASAPKGYFLEKMIAGSGVPAQRAEVTGREIRYVDWLIAGLLGMNMMFSALFGVGYNIVRYRKNGVLKRLKATPLGALEFLMAQVLSRLVLIVVTACAVYAGCNFFLHFQMLGSYADLFLVLVLGGICLISLGLLIAARTASEEFGGGILNLVSWPMMFLSGVWFSLEGTHPVIQKLALIFPLTHVTAAARAIMTEGAGLAQISPHLLALAGMSAIFLTVGSLAFKWE